MTTESPIDTIGIIGAAHAGQTFARVALRAGRNVRIANSRGPQSLGPVVEALGRARRQARPVRRAAVAVSGCVALRLPLPGDVVTWFVTGVEASRQSVKALVRVPVSDEFGPERDHNWSVSRPNRGWSDSCASAGGEQCCPGSSQSCA